MLGTEWSQESVGPGRAEVRCQGTTWCTQCSRGEVTWGRIELVSMGESGTGFIYKRVSMWEKRSECLLLGVLGVNGALGG